MAATAASFVKLSSKDKKTLLTKIAVFPRPSSQGLELDGWEKEFETKTNYAVPTFGYDGTESGLKGAVMKFKRDRVLLSR